MFDRVMAARKAGNFLREMNLGMHVGCRAGTAGECLTLIEIHLSYLRDYNKLCNYSLVRIGGGFRKKVFQVWSS